MGWGWEVGLGVANDTDQSSPIFCSAGTRKGILGFKGCSPASSYPPQVSYLVSPPGLSIASYSRVCRTYLCNNLTNMNAILHLKARTPKTLKSSSHSCPTCVGEHSKSCLPNFVSSESCPRDATKCYSSTVKFQAGERTETFSLRCLLHACWLHPWDFPGRSTGVGCHCLLQECISVHSPLNPHCDPRRKVPYGPCFTDQEKETQSGE